VTSEVCDDGQSKTGQGSKGDRSSGLPQWAAYSRISDAEMMQIMRAAVDRVYSRLLLREKEPSRYKALVQVGETSTASWGEPKLTADF
jgi:hypothetical protein